MFSGLGVGEEETLVSTVRVEKEPPLRHLSQPNPSTPKSGTETVRRRIPSFPGRDGTRSRDSRVGPEVGTLGTSVVGPGVTENHCDTPGERMSLGLPRHRVRVLQ